MLEGRVRDDLVASGRKVVQGRAREVRLSVRRADVAIRRWRERERARLLC